MTDPVYVNEVFTDDDGWVHGTSLPVYGFYYNGSPVGGLVALLAEYWDDPNHGDTRANVYDFPQFDVSGDAHAIDIELAGHPGNVSYISGPWTPDHGSRWIYEGYFHGPVSIGYALAGHPPIMVGSTPGGFLRCVFDYVYATGTTAIPVINCGTENDEFRADQTVPPFIIHFDLTKWARNGTLSAERLHLYQKIIRPGYHGELLAR